MCVLFKTLPGGVTLRCLRHSEFAFGTDPTFHIRVVHSSVLPPTVFAGIILTPVNQFTSMQFNSTQFKSSAISDNMIHMQNQLRKSLTAGKKKTIQTEAVSSVKTMETY